MEEKKGPGLPARALAAAKRFLKGERPEALKGLKGAWLIISCIGALCVLLTLIFALVGLVKMCIRDRIIVLQNGQVENTGTHQQLLDGDSLYRDMWEAHIGAQNWSAGSGKGGN